MKATDIQIGADYAVGGISYTRRATVTGITQRYNGVRIVVQYPGNMGRASGWTDAVPPQNVRRPWAEEQAERDAAEAVRIRDIEKRGDIRAELEGAIATIERVLGIQLLGGVRVHASTVSGHSNITLTGTQLHQLADAIADTGEETP